MMQTYLGNGADDLDGFEFLTMAEAGELAHVEIVAQLNKQGAQPAGQGARRFGDPRSSSGT